MSKVHIIASLEYHADGSGATVTFEDGTKLVQTADESGYIDLSDLWFRDANTGELTQWGEEGAYQTDLGFVAL